MDLIQIIRDRTENAMLAFPKPKELAVKDLTDFLPFITPEDRKLERSNLLLEALEELGQ